MAESLEDLRAEERGARFVVQQSAFDVFVAGEHQKQLEGAIAGLVIAVERRVRMEDAKEAARKHDLELPF